MGGRVARRRDLANDPFGPGERAALALAEEKTLQILTDDAPARNAARRWGLRVAGTLGVLIRAHKRGLAPIRESLLRLEVTNFRLSDDLFARVLRLAEGG